jgi:endonuclease/exonuclease/phosphatase family metal-dependent hydrolase
MKNFAITALLSFLASFGWAQDFIAATYNIRLQTTQDVGNEWDNRKHALCQLINFHEFDIFGVQEAFHNQMEDIQAALPQYKHIGVGRDDGHEKGEYSAVFYNPARFELLSEGTFWLSDTDTERPNKGWDAALPRICTWGIFKDLRNNRRFIFMNTHFDHKGVTARIESGKLILAKAKQLSDGLPIVLTGDFNVDEHSEAYRSLANSGIVRDSHGLAPIVYESSPSFNGWGKNKREKQRIDHIFVSKDFKVEKYGILTDTYQGKYPSDHFPIMTRLSW